MELIATTDRRHGHWRDKAEAARLTFHPEAIADDPLRALAKQAAFRLWNDMDMTGQDWAALKAEATLWASPVCVIPDF